MTQNNIYDWCEIHAVKVLDTSKRAHRYTKRNVKYFVNPFDYNEISMHDISLETESLYTIEISQSELEKIADFENQVFNNLRERRHFGLFEKLMEQKEREKFLKEKYPAVKTAYEQYSLMLKLAESGEL